MPANCAEHAESSGIEQYPRPYSKDVRVTGVDDVPCILTKAADARVPVARSDSVGIDEWQVRARAQCWTWEGRAVVPIDAMSRRRAGSLQRPVARA